MSLLLVPLMFLAFGFVFYTLVSEDEKVEQNTTVVRLFKRDPRGVVEAYHAAWVDTATGNIVEHFGKVGTYGEKIRHARKFKETDLEQIESLLAESRHNYFSEFNPEDFDRLTVQFKFNPYNEVDKKRARVTRSRMRNAVDDEISWTGLGKSTKEKYQKDMMKILFDVSDFEMASNAIDSILKGIETPEYEIVKNRKRRAHSSKT